MPMIVKDNFYALCSVIHLKDSLSVSSIDLYLSFPQSRFILWPSLSTDDFEITLAQHKRPSNHPIINNALDKTPGSPQVKARKWFFLFCFTENITDATVLLWSTRPFHSLDNSLGSSFAMNAGARQPKFQSVCFFLYIEREERHTININCDGIFTHS